MLAFGFAVHTTSTGLKETLIGRLYEYPAMAAPSAFKFTWPVGPTCQPYAIRIHI